MLVRGRALAPEPPQTVQFNTAAKAQLNDDCNSEVPGDRCGHAVPEPLDRLVRAPHDIIDIGTTINERKHISKRSTRRIFGPGGRRIQCPSHPRSVQSTYMPRQTPLPRRPCSASDVGPLNAQGNRSEQGLAPELPAAPYDPFLMQTGSQVLNMLNNSIRVHFEARIPLELYRCIIRHAAYSTRLLYRLCFISRLFRNEAERLLYRKVELEGTYDKLLNWCTTVSSNHRLASLVHELILPSHFRYSNHLLCPRLEARSRLECAFSEALSALKALRILQIYSFTMSNFHYFSPSTFIGRPYRLRTLDNDPLGSSAPSWLPFLQEQPDIQYWSVSALSHRHRLLLNIPSQTTTWPECLKLRYSSTTYFGPPTVPRCNAIALRSISNTLTRLRAEIVPLPAALGDVQMEFELLEDIRENAPNLIFLALQTSINVGNPSYSISISQDKVNSATRTLTSSNGSLKPLQLLQVWKSCCSKCTSRS
jgi:hypothetical protein